MGLVDVYNITNQYNGIKILGGILLAPKFMLIIEFCHCPMYSKIERTIIFTFLVTRSAQALNLVVFVHHNQGNEKTSM